MSSTSSPIGDFGEYVWFDGELIPFHEAKIHVMTYSLHYGVGVFEGIRAYKTHDGRTAIFRLKEHIDRLFESAKIYKLEIPYAPEEVEKAIIDTVRASKFDECYIRPLVFLNITKLGVKPPSRKASLAIGVLRMGRYLGEAYTKGARVVTSAWRRIPPNSLPMNAKATGHYINSYLASVDAEVRGFDEALLLDIRGFVSEGPGQNIFIIKGGKAITPPLYASVLPGITRETIKILLDRELGIDVFEDDISLGMLYSADEAFFTGTAAEVTPIVEVDNIKIGPGVPGPVTRALQQLYDDVVRGKVVRYRKWLTYI
ncbi:MAG: branched-chain amino acid transaminase [Sulfolobales archaeon]